MNDTCPHCGGSGKVRALGCGVFGGRRGTQIVTLRCPKCHGDGVFVPERLALGERRRKDRIRRRLSQREEAARLGITPQHLAQLESGRRSDWPDDPERSESCPTCHGEGQIPLADENQQVHWVPCRRCKPEGETRA